MRCRKQAEAKELVRRWMRNTFEETRQRDSGGRRADVIHVLPILVVCGKSEWGGNGVNYAEAMS